MKKNGTVVAPGTTYNGANGTYSSGGNLIATGDIFTVQQGPHAGNSSCAGLTTHGWLSTYYESYTVGGTLPSSITWHVGGTPPGEPLPHVRLDFWLVNGTHSDQSYTIARTSGVIATPTLGPGEHISISYPDEAAAFSVTIASASGWPPFYIFILGSPSGTGNAWQLVDDGPQTPHYIHGYADTESQTNTTKSGLNFDPTGAPLAGGTNLLTESTFKGGIENLYSQQRSAAENALLVLKGIQGAVGGAGLSNAAVSMGTSATNLNAAAGAVNAAGTNLGVASLALQSASTNLANLTASMGNPGASNITNAKGVGGTSNELGSVSNPYSSYTMGGGPGAWGVSHGAVTPPGGAVNWVIPMGTLGGDVDFNPLHNDSISWTAPIVHNVWVWVFGVSLAVWCGRRMGKAYAMVSAAHQASGPSVTALGTGGSWMTAFVAIALIVSAIAAVPLVWSGFISTHSSLFSLLAVDPLSYFPDLTIMLAWFPVDVLLADMAIGLAFYLSITGVSWTVTTAIRLVPG